MHVIDDETRRFGRLLHYAGVLVTVVCATAGYSFLYAPTIDAIASREARIEELKLSAQNAPVMREQHRKVSETLSDVKDRIANVQRRVPRHADAGEFLKELTQLASAEQLAIKDFHPDKPANRNGYAEMEVTLKGSGSYASICTFVERLSKLNRLSKVKNLSLSVGTNANEYPLTATLIIYFGLTGKETSPEKSAKEERRG
jgi:Tfp pilus assembly protein PilO